MKLVVVMCHLISSLIVLLASGNVPMKNGKIGKAGIEQGVGHHDGWPWEGRDMGVHATGSVK